MPTMSTNANNAKHVKISNCQECNANASLKTNFCFCLFFTTIVLHKIGLMVMESQNNTRAPEPRVQFEVDSDRNCSKSNQSSICCCFANIPAVFRFNSLRTRNQVRVSSLSGCVED